MARALAGGSSKTASVIVRSRPPALAWDGAISLSNAFVGFRSLFKRPSSRAKSSTCSKPLYTLAKRTAATSSSLSSPRGPRGRPVRSALRGRVTRLIRSTAAASSSSCSGATGTVLAGGTGAGDHLASFERLRWPDRFTNPQHRLVHPLNGGEAAAQDSTRGGGEWPHHVPPRESPRPGLRSPHTTGSARADRSADPATISRARLSAPPAARTCSWAAGSGARRLRATSARRQVPLGTVKLLLELGDEGPWVAARLAVRRRSTTRCRPDGPRRGNRRGTFTADGRDDQGLVVEARQGPGAQPRRRHDREGGSAGEEALQPSRSGGDPPGSGLGPTDPRPGSRRP